MLRAINDIPDFFPQVRWLYVLIISSLHLVGFLPKSRLLEAIWDDVQQKSMLGWIITNVLKGVLVINAPAGSAQK